MRAAALVLYRHRFEKQPDHEAISKKTGIPLDALRSAWEIVRVKSESLKSDCEVIR